MAAQNVLDQHPQEKSLQAPSPTNTQNSLKSNRTKPPSNKARHVLQTKFFAAEVTSALG